MSQDEVEIAEVNGTRLSYTSRGATSRGAGRPLLLMHAYTLDRRMWRPQIDALSRRYRVVAVDGRAHGLSAPPDGTPYRHFDDAAALCERLGLERVVAVGLSLGAHQALELALARPDLVAGVVSICMSALAGVPFSDELTALFASVRKAAREQGVGAARALWARAGWFATARETPALAAALDEMLADYSGWHWTHDNPVRNLEPPAARRLGDLRAPALVITGGRDLPYNHAIERALLAGLPGAATLRLPGAGHLASMEEPEAVTRAIAEFAERTT